MNHIVLKYVLFLMHLMNFERRLLLLKVMQIFWIVGVKMMKRHCRKGIQAIKDEASNMKGLVEQLLFLARGR